MDQAKTSGAQALNVLASPLLGNYSNGLFVIARAAALRLPTIHQWPDMAEDGGLRPMVPHDGNLSPGGADDRQGAARREAD